MQYPIFHSVVNKIKSSLTRDHIPIEKFRLWEEPRINATGLEIWIDLRDSTRYLRAVSINFDWDRFRETRIASQLEGTEKHPLLKAPYLLETSVEPVIDIEVVWYFDATRCQPDTSDPNESEERISAASQWMGKVSQKVNALLREDEIITRWHIEVEGDEKGKRLTAIHLISYFQYPLSNLNSLNAVHRTIEQRIRDLLFRVNRVIRIADETVDVDAA